MPVGKTKVPSVKTTAKGILRAPLPSRSSRHSSMVSRSKRFTPLGEPTFKKILFFNGIRWPLFSYLHINSKSLLIIFVHLTQLLEYWTHDTDYMLWNITFYSLYVHITVPRLKSGTISLFIVFIITHTGIRSNAHRGQQSTEWESWRSNKPSHYGWIKTKNTLPSSSCIKTSIHSVVLNLLCSKHCIVVHNTAEK